MGISTSHRPVRFADCKAEPWANGKGITRVIVKGGLRRSSADFDWRLSVADVPESGPFSKLPGVDRVIMVTDGPGLVLKIDEAEHHLVPFRPLPFRGEANTECQVVAPTRDFNVMTRRDVCSATVDVVLQPGVVAAPADFISYVTALKGEVEVHLSQVAVTLGKFDTVLLGSAAHLRMTHDALAAVVQIRPHLDQVRGSREIL